MIVLIKQNLICQANLYYIFLKGKCKPAIKYSDKKIAISLKPHITGVILTTIPREYIPDRIVHFIIFKKDYLEYFPPKEITIILTETFQFQCP